MPAKRTSASGISLMKQVFSEQGIPQVVRTNNGPQFSSREFSEFAATYGFQHVTSSSLYPRSNGFIESQVKVVKKTLEKVACDNTDPHLALLYLRSMPVESKMPSPAQLLQGPTFHNTLPKISTRGDKEVMEHLEKKQQHQKVLYDQHTRKR